MQTAGIETKRAIHEYYLGYINKKTVRGAREIDEKKRRQPDPECNTDMYNESASAGKCLI